MADRPGRRRARPGSAFYATGVCGVRAVEPRDVDRRPRRARARRSRRRAGSMRPRRPRSSRCSRRGCASRSRGIVAIGGDGGRARAHAARAARRPGAVLRARRGDRRAGEGGADVGRSDRRFDRLLRVQAGRPVGARARARAPARPTASPSCCPIALLVGADRAPRPSPTADRSRSTPASPGSLVAVVAVWRRAPFLARGVPRRRDDRRSSAAI